MRYFCCDPHRLDIVKQSSTLNAIEWVEVLDHLEPAFALRQRTLFVRLLRPGFTLTGTNVLIDGGARIEHVEVEWAAPAGNLPANVQAPPLASVSDDLARTLVVRTRSSGDFSRYTLHLRAAPGSDTPPGGFDPRLSQIGFSFKVECPSDFDCQTTTPCVQEPAAAPEIDYLAKDYPALRRMMLDRLTLVAPGWRERSAADVGVALVELMAYAADNLSYRQDAIANEAYLATAHRRESVRRHARLVDYTLHEGCNARAWVLLEVSADVSLLPQTALLTRSAALPTELVPGSRPVRDAIAAGAQSFETAAPVDLYVDHNRFSLYTWGDRGCCLPRGATQATLRGDHPALKVNDVIVFQELRSPSTLKPEDADPTHRWAVRLTKAQASQDPCGRLFDTPPVNAPLALTEIEWDTSDALPFPLCVSVCENPTIEISAAFGNMVLVDHGRSVATEDLPVVPEPRLVRLPAAASAGPCSDDDQAPTPMVPARFRPALIEAPLTQGFALADELAALPADEEAWWSASAILQRDPHDAWPSGCTLRETQNALAPPWLPQRELLGSLPSDPHFVVETANDGTARLRFGDDQHGKRPNPGTLFSARYRVGNGAAGNVGAGAIAHVLSGTTGVFLSASNPMAAAGGVDPEDIEAARRDAPEAFRRQERAVTAADYAEVSERRTEVQRAAASFRWTGSWHTVFVTADRRGGGAVDAGFESRLRRHLERFRMAGYDVEVDGPRNVPLDITLHICVKPEHFRARVLRELRAELGSAILPDGRRAVFHPDNFTFAQPVYLSRIVAAAQAVEGVEAVWAQKFERLGSPNPASLADGVIPIGRLEVAQLANDRNFRERGRLVLEAGGGK